MGHAVFHGPLTTTLSVEVTPATKHSCLHLNPLFPLTRKKQSMNSSGLFSNRSPFSSAPASIKKPKIQSPTSNRTLAAGFSGRKPGCKTVTRCSNGGRRTFLTLEEAGLVEISGLSTHEKFLCRLTISSLNLLRVIAEQEGKKIEELNAGDLCDWFLKDKLKREQDVESAVLQWDDSEILI